jgi:hypothetical protein
MGVILFFVFRSMAKHLRKVNDAARQDAAAEATDADLAASTTKDPASPR